MHPPKKSASLGAADLAVVTVGVIVFAYLFGLRRWGYWYSGDWIYRQQTDAMLSGTLAMLPTPHLQRYDWAWGVGSQQIWGLGMPLIRLPFEAAARALGQFGFPDTLTFIFYFALVATALARAFHAVDGAGRARAVWERAAPLAVVLFCPAFITMCRTRFEVYEEAIGAAFLWAALLGALLLMLVEHPRARTLALLCGASGVTMMFRPTAIAYGAVAAALGLILGWRAQLGRRALAGSALLFALGVAAQLAVNQLRFQSPFEFGQLLNISYNTIDQLAKNFGAPYWHEPLRRAVPELLSALFLSKRANGYWFYQANVLDWQSPTLRFREFYFGTFRPWMALPVLGGWGGALTAFIMRRRSPTALALLADGRIAYLALFSFAAFLCESAFYLRVPAITSRYVVDFAAALAFAMATLALIGFGLVRVKLSGRGAAAASAAIALSIMMLIAYSIYSAWIGPVQSHRRLMTAKQVSRELLLPTQSPPEIPASYRCGQSMKDSGITMNGVGWASTSNCIVTGSSPFFLPATECITLHLAPKAGEPPLDAESMRPIRARRGLVPMIRVRNVAVEDGRLLTFCAPPRAPANPTGIDLVSVAWVDPVTTPPNETHFRLLEIAKTSR